MFYKNDSQCDLLLTGGTFTPECHKEAQWRPPDLATLPAWHGVRRIGLDTETKDPQILELGPGVRRRGGDQPSDIVGISFALENGPKHYLPFGHEGGDNLPRENCLAYIRDQLATYDGEIVGANLPYDMDWLMSEAIRFPMVRRFRDVQVADPLINELEFNYKLDTIAKRRLGATYGKDETLLRSAAAAYRLNPKYDLHKMAARFVGPYAEWDAALPLEILAKQEELIDRDELREVWDIECRLLPILVAMTRRGVRVDMDRIEIFERFARKMEQDAWDIVNRYAPVGLTVGDAMNVDKISTALRHDAVGLGHVIGATPIKGDDSINKDALHAHRDHPVAAAILDARKASVLRTTFVNGVRAHAVQHGDEWRIHCTFNQIRRTDDKTDETKGVGYGRLSASHPNMQNQPAADRRTGDNRIGCMWRSVFKPDVGTMWTGCDCKQQEPRWSFHYGALMERLVNAGKIDLPNCRRALDLCERLRADPQLDTYIPLVEMTGQPRPVCKILWLARAYGNGDGSLCKSLGLGTREVTYNRRLHRTVPVDSPEGREAKDSGSFTWEGAGEEGQKIIDAFDGEMPFLKAVAKFAQKQAERRGYVKLISGRRCHFERKAGGKGFEWCHKAFNRIIQGTSAEQIKRDMLAVVDAGFGDGLMLQVHDELDFSFETEKQGDDVAAVMRDAVPMEVPVVIDIERGDSWGESMTMETVMDGQKIKRKYVWDCEG